MHFFSHGLQFNIICASVEILKVISAKHNRISLVSAQAHYLVSAANYAPTWNDIVFINLNHLLD